MQFDIPFRIEYETPEPVPISDVIESLLALDVLIREGGQNLAVFIPDVQVNGIRISVQSISQLSPLREILLVSLFLAFQKDIEAEVPSLLEHILGAHIPQSMDTIVSLLVLIVLFYGAAFAKDVALNAVTNTLLKKQVDILLDELEKRTDIPKDKLRYKLEQKYSDKTPMHSLASAAIKLFRPSKRQNNARMKISDRPIEPELISEVPEEFVYEHSQEITRSQAFDNVKLELHAQDRDKESTGWAAIPHGISKKRLRMRLVDGVSPSQLWNKGEVVGNIILVSKKEGIEYEPKEIHLTHVDH